MNDNYPQCRNTFDGFNTELITNKDAYRRAMPQSSNAYHNYSVGSDDFFVQLEKILPAVFTRQTVAKALGGLISAKTLSNLDSLGLGPSIKQKIELKVCYEKRNFIDWLRARLK